MTRLSEPSSTDYVMMAVVMATYAYPPPSQAHLQAIKALANYRLAAYEDGNEFAIDMCTGFDWISCTYDPRLRQALAGPLRVR